MNDYVRRNWQAGLDVLRPRRRDLERGLELHREHLVFEVYGFAPKMAPDADALNAELDAAAPPQDMPARIMDSRVLHFLADEARRNEYADAWEAAGVDAVVYSVAEADRPPAELMRDVARHIHLCDRRPHVVRRCTAPTQVLDARREGRRAIVLAANTVPLAGQGAPVEHELAFVRALYHLGCHEMHLTYNRRNLLGEGCMETDDAGLSDLGRAAIAEMNRLGVIVDVAHCAHRTSREAARASRQPIVASHTAASALHEHPRNKPDDVLDAIADGGGIVGVVAVPDFLGGTADLAAVLDHLDYIARRIGVDHIGIGMDRAYEPPELVDAMKSLRHRTPPPLHALWRPGTLGDPRFARPRMWRSTDWTNWPLITVGLVQRGYSDDDIEKIIGANMLRLWRNVYRANP